MKVREIVRSALQKIGVLAEGETPSAAQGADALSALNDMLGLWSLDRLLVHSRVRETFPLVAGQQSYTMGPDGDFDTSRPIEIKKVMFLAGDPVQELKIDIQNLDQWAALPSRNLQDSQPRKVYIVPGTSIQTLQFSPIPSGAPSIAIYSDKAIVRFASLNDEVDLPPGYDALIKLGLSIQLAPDYGKEPSLTTLSTFNEAMSRVQSNNITPTYLQCDPAIVSNRGGFDYTKGE